MKKITIILLIVILYMVAMAEEKKILFLSTQLNPVEEANVMKNILLKDFKYKVDFKPYSDMEVFSYLAEGNDSNVD